MGFLDDLKSKFGFGDEWDDFDDEEAQDGYGYDANSTRLNESTYESGAATGAVRRRPRQPDLDRASQVSGVPLRSVPAGQATVRPMVPQMRIFSARPKGFEEASEFADKFKSGTPVLLDLTYVAPDLQRRLIDFASGMTYGLNGEINKVSDGIFMLTPHNVELSDADRKRFGSPSPTRL